MSFECLDCKAIDGGYCVDCVTHNDELREWLSMKQATHKAHKNDAAIRVLDELEAMIEDD